jgi:hypothetical protein
MKRIAFWSVGICLLMLSACASKEELRVENVLGPYDIVWLCNAVDLTAQNPNVETSGEETIFVTKPEDWEDGFIAIGDRVVFLEPDSSFGISEVDYFLAGEFTASGQLIFSETHVDRANNLRNDCEFVGYLK